MNPGSAWPTWLPPAAPLPQEELATANWPAIVSASREHHVSATLYSRLLAGDCVSLVPETERVALQFDHQRASIDALLWQRALRMVLPALSAEAVLAVPYKGAALAFLAYHDPAARSMSDIDLWIDADDMPRACAALERLGFERREKSERPMVLQATYDGEIPFSGRRIGVPLVELHWGVFAGEWLRRAAAIDREAVRARCVPATLFGSPVEVLSAEDHLIQVALHASVNHVLSMAAVRSLLDLVVISHAGVDWASVIARAREWRLSTVLGHTFHLTGELFAQPAFVQAGLALAPASRVRRLYRFASPQSILRGDRLDLGLRKWRYLTAVVDRRHDGWRLVMRSLWPETEWLGARYGSSGLSSRARHLAGAVRGRF